MSYVLHQSIECSRIWNLKYYVICFCLLFTEKMDFLLVNKRKKNVSFEELKKRVNKYYVIFEIPNSGKLNLPNRLMRYIRQKTPKFNSEIN